MLATGMHCCKGHLISLYTLNVDQQVAVPKQMKKAFQALVLAEKGVSEVRTLSADDLPAGDVSVDVAFSSINFKDALAVTGAGKIIRGSYPFVPGIDLAGRVRASSLPEFHPGDRVILTGGGLGESMWGGYSQLQRVSSEFMVALPKDMALRTSMILGTAGLTAMLSILALERHGINSGTIIVTAASGGVGMSAVYLLNQLGYRVVASCGSRNLWHKLQTLGAESVENRMRAAKPLERGRWDGAIDAAGGTQLAAVLAGTRRHGCVAASGNAGGAELRTTVYPFILRGVTLAGVDSNTATVRDRRIAWARLHEMVSESDADRLLMATVTLPEIPRICKAKIEGRAPGRFIVDLNRGDL